MSVSKDRVHRDPKGSRSGAGASVAASVLLTSALVFFGNVAHAEVRTAHSSLVSENASFFTPGALDGRVEAIAIDGDTVFVGGTFTQIQEALDGDIIDQAYLYAYSKSTGAVIRDFDPVLDGAVRALQTTGEGRGVFAGGVFTTVNGETNRRGLVKLDDFGDRVQSFEARPDKRVYAMDRSGDKLYIGGNFTRIGQLAVEYLAAVDTETGALLPDIDLDFDGTFSTSSTTGFASVDAIEVTSDDRLMVVVGNFRSIDGISRSRLALLELEGQARVSTWNTDVFDVNCPSRRFPQYINGIDIAPDDSYFVTGTTGFRIVGEPACDSILRFELDDLSDSNVEPTWSSYTGGDSVYEVAVSEHAVYAGGHFRWLNNGYGGDYAGPGAVARRGFAALDPLNGLPLLDWRSDRNPRGVGVFALEVQPEGLYVGDDTDFLDGFYHPKFKFLPTTSDAIERPEAPSLPTTALSVRGQSLDATAFDGTTLGATTAMSGSGWRDARGAMFIDGRLFHADDDGRLWVSALREDDTFGSPERVDLFGLTRNQWDLSRLGGMFFDHEQGRVYYTLEGDARLFWRAFTPDGPLFGDFEFVADVQGDILWSDVQGMDVIDGQLYFGRTDGNLYRAAIDGSSPVPGTTEVISGPGIDSRDWSAPLLAFSSGRAVRPPQATAEYRFESAGSSGFNSFKKFEFQVEPGEAVNVRLTWDDPNARLNVFLRDANDRLVDADSDSTGGSPKWLSAPAGEGGTYTVAVKIKEGSTAYVVSVNPAVEPPEPRADFEFNTSGSESVNRWQTFSFAVQAGDLVEARVSWDDPSASVKVFLRDETGTQVDRDTDLDGSPETVSAIAMNDGEWSVAVRIERGAIEYDVLVDINGDE